jgi:hypothetical protein
VQPPRLTTSSWFALGDGAAERLYGYAHDYLANFGERAAGAMAGLCRLSDAGVLRDSLIALRETGCDEVVLVPTTLDPAEIDRLEAALNEPSAGRSEHAVPRPKRPSK